MEEKDEGLWSPNGIGMLQEDQQSQLTWTLGGISESELPTKEHTWTGLWGSGPCQESW